MYLTQNYLNGELNGKSIRYSYLNEEKYLCSDVDKEKSSNDTCIRFVYEKVKETLTYKDDELNGFVELLDSNSTLIAKGYFKDGLKEGEWIHRYTDKDFNNDVYYYFQKGQYLNDKREGKWSQYQNEIHIVKTFYYKNGLLHGEYFVLNNFKNPSEKKIFNNGKLTELITFDSLGLNPVDKYEIYDLKSTGYKCRWTKYIENGYFSQEYWVETNEEINHYFFELIFGMAVGKFSDSDEISSFKTGFKDGEFKVFDKNNNIVVSGKFYKEDRIGLWTFYYDDQNVKIESNFKYNDKLDEKYYTLDNELFSGTFIYFDVENDIKEERKISNGLRNGKTIYFDLKTDKTIRKESYKNGILD